MITVAAWIIAGAAIGLTRSVLDMYGDASRSPRVALLPSAPELAGFVALGLLGGAAVAALVNRWTNDPARRAEARLQIALPLGALVVVAFPYAPVLPDIIRPLRAFAGPITWIIWISVAGLVVMTALAVRRSLRPPSRPVFRSPGLAAAAIFLATLAISGTAGTRLRDSLTYPSGDEPHYMVMMQSLWRDHDLRIQNNYEQRDYDDYFAPTLTPELSSRGKNGQLYSSRPIGLAIAGAPVLAGFGYHGLVWALVFVAGVTATLMWRWAFEFTKAAEAATMAWAAIFLGAPVLFTSVAVYPDIPAALCVMIALGWRSKPEQQSEPSATLSIVRGLSAAALPWLSAAYLPVAVCGVIVSIRRLISNRQAPVILLAIFSVSIALWLSFFHSVWGRWSPLAPLPDGPLFGNLFAGTLGLLFDHEFGVLAYAPALSIGLVGLFKMSLSSEISARTLGRELALVFGALLIGAGAAAMWWGGAAPPGRPLVPVLPLLGLPIAWMYQRASESPVRRAAYQLLIFIGAAFSLSMLFGQDGGLIAQDRDGSSRLLQWLTSLWPAWEAMPAVAAFGLRHALPLIALWIVAAVAVAWLMDRTPVRAAGFAALAACLYLATAMLMIAIIGPVLSRPASAWVLQPESRSRVPALDTFDSSARPHAVIYNRFTIVNASDIPPLMTLAASPGERPSGQPVRVLLNARYALAAGDYEVTVAGIPGNSESRGALALQVGRIGSPMTEWDVDIPPGGSWHHEFKLPVDAEFVGFVASPPIDTATSLRIRPISIVDKSRREANVHGMTFTVLSAVAFPTSSVFFHDEDVYPERSGVWVHGESTTTMTVAPVHPERGVTLRVHSGATPNTVTFATTTWGERVELTPGISQDVHVPPPAKPGPFLLRVTTDKSFVPAEVVPGSTDRRILGCWIEILE